MDRIALRLHVKLIRASVSKRRREEIHGTVDYHCRGCGAAVRVGLAHGVADPDDRRSGSHAMDVSTLVECIMEDCDGIMAKQSGSFSIDCTGYVAIMRIPSRRVAKQMIDGGDVEPQIVVL